MGRVKSYRRKDGTVVQSYYRKGEHGGGASGDWLPSEREPGPADGCTLFVFIIIVVLCVKYCS